MLVCVCACVCVVLDIMRALENEGVCVRMYVCAYVCMHVFECMFIEFA